MVSSLELARICGVSQGTVDRALHNRPGISEKTKKNILTMAEKHGYMANPAALEIMGRGSNMLGVLTPVLNSPMLMGMVQEIHNVVMEQGYRTFTTPFKNDQQLLEGLKEFAARKAAGVIVFPDSPTPTIPENIVKAIKVISLMEPITNKKGFYVSPDNHRIAELCTQKLIDCGHKRLLMINFDLDRVTSHERSAGYKACVKKNKVEGYQIFEGQMHQLPQLVKEKEITGIYGHSDELAFHAMQILEAAGILSPQDISIIGGQDSPLIKNMVPNLSNFDYPAKSIGKVILAILKGKRLPQVADPTYREGTSIRDIS